MKRTSRMILLATAALMAAAGALANAPTYMLGGGGGSFSPFPAARAMLRAEGEATTFILGVPGAPKVRITTNASQNEWLASNPAMLTMAIGAPTGGISKVENSDPRMRLASAEGGFPFERSKPDFYLGDAIREPEGVDWIATYKAFQALTNASTNAFLFDPHGHRVYATLGGQVTFNWMMLDGTTNAIPYNIAPVCSGRPRRIYWTDEPYNAPAVDLSGKFVRFFGPEALLKPQTGTVTSTVGGITQTITNKIVSGLVQDQSTHMLFAYGELQGQVVMAYYETGTFEKILHVQVVEICRPSVNRLTGEIGRALKPDGRGYPTEGLRAQPTPVTDNTDNRGDYYYQHQGQQSYSPKHGNVYPLRPTVDCPWNMEVYWMETDEMLVDWPFELDQYACDWPEDATVFVRGGEGDGGGRPVFIPSDYTGTLMDYQEPEGHARAVEKADGTFRTTGAGWSLLKLTADDNVWFVPVRSVLRSDTNFFTLEPESWVVGRELELRGGSVAGLAPGFSPKCDPSSPGFIHEAASDPVWNPDLYQAPQADSAGGMASETNIADSAESGSDTNDYASVVYAVRPGRLEVWWNTVVQEEDMPAALEIPTLPQVYDAEWPVAQSVPQIVLASQLGSASESLFTHNAAIYLAETGSVANLPSRTYFDTADGGTLMFWVKAETDVSGNVAIAGLHPGGTNALVQIRNDAVQVADGRGRWRHVAVTLSPSGDVRCLLDGAEAFASNNLVQADALGGEWTLELGRLSAGGKATAGLAFGEILLWNRVLSDEEIAEERYKAHTGRENHLTGCGVFREGEDLEVTGTDEQTFTEKVLGMVCTAGKCLMETEGPPAIGTGVIVADEGTTPKLYVQNDPAAVGYNPNEEHAILQAGSGGWVAWALRCDLNTADSSAPGVLVEYAKDGRKAMQWFAVAATNEIYPELAADCVAGKAFPGPHPIDFFENPWCAEDTWDEAVATAPAFRDRKGQLWARCAGTATMRMYYRMQDGFAFPSISGNQWPAVGTAVPWLSLLDGNPASSSVLSASPQAWTWRVKWPETVPEMEIGRTLTTAASGLPEVWNAKSVAVVWPPTDAERDATALLFDPTVAQTSGFSPTQFVSVAAAVQALGIKQGAGGNASLRKGRWTFDGLPPSVAGRFYLDTTADLGRCLKLEGEREDNPGGVELLHVNVLNAEERSAIASVLDDVAEEEPLKAWKAAVAALATAPVRPSPHAKVSGTEDRVAYVPRDHYALFSMGATNYVTIIENDADETVPLVTTVATATATNSYTNQVATGVKEGDPISMHVFKVVPKYYTGRVVTREDPVNLLSQQLSVIYEEAFAGKPEDYEFEWRKARPHTDGSVPTDFDGDYANRGKPEAGLTRFVVGGQGDTLDNMVNTYYAMRYRAASSNSPAWAAMGDQWSEWTDPPALAEGWVQRVLNNVTPFAQRMRDLEENEAETAVSMIRQAGAPYEGDVALNQDNLTEVGLIQLYETILSKAESLSLALDIDDADANKQLQLAVARLADLYGVLGDEAWTDALNPTIGFGGSFDPEAGALQMDYGALSSALFAFDNQVPTLLDEELALLRGRSGDNAPSTHLSPYYNRLVWNFTRGITAGEVAYAVNYDISGDNKGVIDYQQAAEMFPQGHGDAYGHYLSALSGYYRLLRNPFFSWGTPAMGEMVVADSVVNVDYYDEAKFAKAAYDVAKTAAAVVDRTARKAVRDNNGAAAAGYLDKDPTRAFGWGEWASRGGFGALANWAVGNVLLPETPDPGRYWHLAFEKDGGLVAEPTGYDAMEAELGRGGPWTIEFQAVADPNGSEDGTLLSVMGTNGTFGIDLAEGNVLVAWRRNSKTVTITNTVYSYTYEKALSKIGQWFTKKLKFQKGNKILECTFECKAFARFLAGFPDSLPKNYDLEAALASASATNGPVPPQWDGWDCLSTRDETTGAYKPYVYETYKESYILDEDSPRTETHIGTVPRGRGILVALRSTGEAGTHPVVSVFDATKAKIAEAELDFDLVPTPTLLRFGAFDGEAGELRHWKGHYRTDAELMAKVACVSPLSDGLVLYLRTIASSPSRQIADSVSGVVWDLEGGHWIAAEESGLEISFDDEGLNRIDRGSVQELASLASLIPDIQRKVDRLDAGLSPIGLADGAMAFDLTPINAGDGGKTHYEQIRERAGIALENARRSLDKAQEWGSRLRLLQEAQVAREDRLETMELETKNKLIEYFGYPYEGDIGPGGTYPQGYDGPDLYHYAWMDLAEFGITNVADTVTHTTLELTGATSTRNWSIDQIIATNTFTFNLSANGFVLKPDTIGGKRRARGKIQDALADFLLAYAKFNGAKEAHDYAYDVLLYEGSTARGISDLQTALEAFKAVKATADFGMDVKSATLKCTLNALELACDIANMSEQNIRDLSPHVVGAGMTVNIDPSAVVAAATTPELTTAKLLFQSGMLAAKNSLEVLDGVKSGFELVESILANRLEGMSVEDSTYTRIRDAAEKQYDAMIGVQSAWRQLEAAQAAVETVVAEAERVIDERTLARAQAADVLTKARYNEMFFRLVRNSALSRYDAQFELAQKYAWLAAQAYDYETGLISSDRASGEAFLARIVGARTLGEFDGSGNPMVASDAAKGDGGLAAILAEMDENWLVLKPRLGINNPQPYATWFSLRHDLFRILDGQDGDRAWKDTLRKYMVDDLRAVPEFTHYCQPLAGSTAEKEPGLVIPFPSVIAAGVNFFGNDLAGGDAALDPTWYATHLSAAGVHFVGYDAANLSRTPSAYLVPVGEDRMRAVGDPDTVLSWKVVDQTIPAPYAIGSAQLDDPDWTPLFDGATGGNDLGARIRKHPSFRAYYAPEGDEPSDSSLDCTRLVGRSAWNTRWLLVIPASSLGSDRETALAAFINGFDADRDGTPESGGVSDIRLGLKTYSTSGN